MWQLGTILVSEHLIDAVSSINPLTDHRFDEEQEPTIRYIQFVNEMKAETEPAIPEPAWAGSVGDRYNSLSTQDRLDIRHQSTASTTPLVGNVNDEEVGNAYDGAV